MPVVELGHVGLHVNDLTSMREFYEDVLGLTHTDSDEEAGMVFLSSRPELEHHELLLCGGRDAPIGAQLIQQVAFRSESIDDVREVHQKLVQHGAKIDMTVSHGNAVGVYFYDPEGNRVEVYCRTDFEARQPFIHSVDLTASVDDVTDHVRKMAEEHGETGYVEQALIAKQNI